MFMVGDSDGVGDIELHGCKGDVESDIVHGLRIKGIGEYKWVVRWKENYTWICV
jgi:hypothetical protein